MAKEVNIGKKGIKSTTFKGAKYPNNSMSITLLKGREKKLQFIFITHLILKRKKFIIDGLI